MQIKIKMIIFILSSFFQFFIVSVPLFVHFSFSPMEISVTDFTAPTEASVFKFCVHLQEGKVNCVNGN